MSAEPVKLTEMEEEVLRECAGERPARPWGAAVAACLEALEVYGFFDRYEVTAAGRQYLVETNRQHVTTVEHSA